MSRSVSPRDTGVSNDIHLPRQYTTARLVMAISYDRQ